MITRLSTITCPECGHVGKPKVKGEGPVLLTFIPFLGKAIAAKDAAMAELNCAKCDAPFTESHAKKVSAAAVASFRGIGNAVSAARESLSRPADPEIKRCCGCGKSLKFDARFCDGCGSATGG